MDWPEDGSTLRAHLRQVEKATGMRDARLDAVKIPEGYEALWARYWEINAAGVMTYQELESYCRMTGWAPAGHEVKALFAMAGEQAAFIAERGKRDARHS